MTTTILGPRPVLSAVEATRLRKNFKWVVEDGSNCLVVDLSGVQELSAAGLASITNLLAQGRRIGIDVLRNRYGTRPTSATTPSSCVIRRCDVHRILSEETHAGVFLSQS